jgi:hypothetical protein
MFDIVRVSSFFMGKFELYIKSYLRLTSTFIHTTIMHFLCNHLLTLNYVKEPSIGA